MSHAGVRYWDGASCFRREFMDVDLPNQIADWFDKHPDGEFVHLSNEHPYQIIGPTSADDRIVFTTKPDCVVDSFQRLRATTPLPVIGRRGLPQLSDLGWIQRMIDGRNALFVGDCDPADLLVFVWLRAHLNIQYCGICDALLAALRVPEDSLLSIPLSESEAGALLLVESVWPDFSDSLGPRCVKLLASGRKYELEGVMNAASEPMGWLADLP